MSELLEIAAKQSIVSVPLGDVLVEIRNGLVADQEKEKPGIPITRIETISKGVVDLERVRYVRNTDGLKLDRFWLKSGDILFSHINSDLHLGKTAIVMSDAPLLHGMNLLVLRTDREKLLPRYLHHWLDFCRRSGVFMAIAQHAVNQSSLNQKKITSLRIPLPSIDEQEKIVAELEKQFSRLDEAVANLQRVKANLKRYKASVLKDAVEGRLVPTEAELARREGRTFETGEQLLQRLLEVRRARPKGKSKYKEPAEPDTSGVGEVPDGWVWASVEQLVAHLTDGDHQAPPQTDSGVPFLVIGNVRGGEIDLADTRFVGEAYYNSLDPYRQPKLGDLLYTLVGSYGIPVRVKTEEPFCIQRHMAILRPHEQSPMDYLTIAMESNEVFKQATAVATGTAQMTVPLSGLRKIAIGLPPDAEQRRIVAEVDRRLSLVRGVEAEVDTNLKRARALRQATLAKAFA